MAVLSRLIPAVLALASLAIAQDSGSPLNDFISAAGSAAAVINSWNAAQSTAGPSAASSLSAAASSAASDASSRASALSTAPSDVQSSVSAALNSATATASGALASATSDGGPESAPQGIDPHTRTIIIAVAVVVGVLLLALIAFLVCCCCRRRRRRSKRAGTPLTDEGADWDEHPANPHHSYASSHGVVGTGPSKRYSDTTSMSQRDSAPLMSGATGHFGRGPIDNSDHPAYRTNDPNANNPFTPQPPLRRKPIPISTSTTPQAAAGTSTHKSHSPALAAGVAGAALGAAAIHHHDNKKNHSPVRNSHPSTPTLPPIQETSPNRDRKLSQELERDPNRPPTPFGLAALGFGNSRKSGAIEPTVADHYAGPTDEQRRSLHERERRFSWNPDEDSEAALTSPHSTDMPSPSYPPAVATVATGAGRKRTQSAGNHSAFHDSTYGSYRDDSSGESRDSWKSAQMGPQLGGLWDDSERRYSGDYVLPNRTYGDRGSGMMDGGNGNGKGKRLRFSDERPLEIRHYDDNTSYNGGYSAVGQAY